MNANAANASVIPPVKQSTEEELYQSDVRHVGREWADVYHAQRQATTKAERIAADRERVRLAHIASEQRTQADRKEAEARRQKAVQETTQIIFGNADKQTIREMLHGESLEVIQETIERAKGSTLPFIWESHLSDIKAGR
jgi:hypothetical protein